MKRFATVTLLGAFLAAPLLIAATASAPAPPVLRIPGQTEKPVTPESLLGRDQRDVRIEETNGDVTVYHGMPLLAVLEKNGLDLKTMAGERQSAAAVVLASGRDGYTVVFSVGELRDNRANHKVFLGEEKEGEKRKKEKGKGRGSVVGEGVRSGGALATIELKNLAPKKP